MLDLYLEGLEELTDTFGAILGDEEIIKKVRQLIAEAKEPEPEPEPEPETLADFTYWKDDDINGDIFHVAENILNINLKTCSTKEKLMAMKMARINRKGKCASFVQAEYVQVLNITKEELARLSKELESEHGKYSTKDAIMKRKVNTTSIYDNEHMQRVINFTKNMT